jgi:ubiquinone biosynthesis monooxygenase Coq7
MRHFNLIDQVLTEAQHFLDTIFQHPLAQRGNPASTCPQTELTPVAKKISQGYMRVNHTGEICAQALYRGQAFGTKNTSLQEHFHTAATEEVDHLNWCQERLKELDTHVSYLNPLWYSASFLIGLITAQLGDKLSLGFVEETEQQVVQHLQHHQQHLPKEDQKSLAIISTMTADEARHAQQAHNSGAQALPTLLKLLMKAQSKIMTTTAYYF